jgi:hypothetical protein
LDIRLDEGGDLVTELELVEDLLNVWGEAVEVSFEVRPELLLFGARLEVAERERRHVVEGLSGCLPQRRVLVGDASPVKPLLHIQPGLLGGLQYGIQPADHRHGQDDVSILAAHVDIAQDVVGDPPDEVGDPAKLVLLHCVITP